MTIWLSQAVALTMQSHGENFYPLEVGGVLLGWRDGEHRIVTGLVGPGPKSLHGRHAFVPDHLWQVDQIRKAFTETGGDLDYLGDWHSHPNGAAQMSAMDDSTLSRIARRVANPLMAIVAGGPSDWQFGGWSANRRALFRRAMISNQPLRVFEPPSHWPTYGA